MTRVEDDDLPKRAEATRLQPRRAATSAAQFNAASMSPEIQRSGRRRSSRFPWRLFIRVFPDVRDVATRACLAKLSAELEKNPFRMMVVSRKRSIFSAVTSRSEWRRKMLSRFVPALAGVAMAATVGSAFAFDADCRAEGVADPCVAKGRPNRGHPGARRDQHGALRSRMVRGGLRGPDWVMSIRPSSSARGRPLPPSRRPAGTVDRANHSADRSDRRGSRRRSRVPRPGRRGGPLMRSAPPVGRTRAGGARRARRRDCLEAG